MGSFRTVRAVTQAIQRLLSEGLSREPEYANARVTVGSPHHMHNDRSTEQVTINLFLYHVRPEPSLRNLNLPIYEGNRMVNVPSIGLDLYYLLSFYGPKRNDLESEDLLGLAVSTLNAKPVLRAADFVASHRAGASHAAQDLHGLDPVSLSPMSLTIEEMQRLWAMFPNTPYTLSMSYRASAALLVSDDTPAPRLPVSKPQLQPTAASGAPVLISLVSPDAPESVAVFGSSVALQGARLSAPLVAVDVGGMRLSVDPSQVTTQQIKLDLNARGLAAGTQDVVVVHLDATESRVLASSNALVLTLLPEIRSSKVEVDAVSPSGSAAHSSCTGRLLLEVSPPLKPGQALSVVLNESHGDKHAYAFPAVISEHERSKLSVPFSGVVSGRYLVRVEVDGASSVLSQAPGKPFRSPHLTISARHGGRGG